MNYYIDIIDTTNDEHTTVVENARASSIVLKWSGKDAIDELDVVGSSLMFSMEAKWNENEDGHFIHLFTGNEVKYRVEIRGEEDDFLFWQGFLLPDSYTEPYKTANYFVDLEATDGLGRLKGKYLPDSFYEEENKVTDIICKCLELTGLQFDVVFAPGIDNKTVKNWHEIYVDGTKYTSSNKPWTAYKILQTFLQDTVSCVYQNKATWYVEGLNKRNLLEYSAKVYSYDGTYQNDTTIVKTVVDVSGDVLGAGNVTMVPPYNNITVTHTAKALQLPETIATEENDGWVTEAAGVVGEIYATDWYPNSSGFWAVAKAPEYKLYLAGSNNATFNSTYYVYLRKKIYVRQDTKLKFTLKLSIDYYGNENSNTIDGLIEDGKWTNPLYYKVQVNSETLYTNLGDNVTTAETISFNSDKEAEIAFEFIVPEPGLFNVVIYQPFGTYSNTRIKGVFIEEIELEQIGFDEEIIYTEDINDEYTVDKEVELTFADDATGLSNCFQLAKLNSFNTGLVVSNVIPIISGFTQNGNYYSVVSLAGANLIADNIDSVYYGGTLLENLEVTYNYGGGEQMVVKTESALTSGNFAIAVYRYLDYTLDRTSWEEWTDSVYQIERKRFPEAVLGVYRRMFENPSAKADMSVKDLVFFGDLVSWDYQDTYNYVPTNVSIDLDKGFTSLVMSKASYLQTNALVPPYVDAGPDIFLYDDESVATFDATAYDPDGTIVTYLWEHVSGTPAGTIVSSATEDTSVTGLTGNSYTYQITVTDNDGLTASDTVDVIRVINYTATLPNTDSDTDLAGDRQYKEYEYTLGISPSFNETLFMTLNGIVDLEVLAGGLGDNTADAKVTLIKNGVTIQEWEVNAAGGTPTEAFVETYNTLFGFIYTDVIKIVLRVDRFGDGGAAYALARFTLDFATIQDYPGTVLGPPIEIEQTIST